MKLKLKKILSILIPILFLGMALSYLFFEFSLSKDSQALKEECTTRMVQAEENGEEFSYNHCVNEQELFIRSNLKFLFGD
ncbi:MAG: hypothetical protein ACJKSS_01355 [Patescibacteria group bacterium UBA2103]